MAVVMRFMGCELRKGCTFIGALWLVFSVLITVGGPLTMAMFDRINEEELLNLSGTGNENAKHIIAITLTVLRACFYGVTAIAVVDAVFSIMLIIGAQKEKSALLLAWLVEQVALMPLWAVGVLTFAAMCFVTFNGTHVLLASIIVTVVAVRIAMTLYSILVVYGLHEQLRRQQEPISLLNDM